MARIHADGTVERSRVRGGGGLSDPTVAPGGGRLAAVRTTYDDRCFATSSSLVTVRLRDGNVSAPLLTVIDGQFALSRPAWSPDGARIAVVKQNPCCTGVGESSDIDVVASDGSSNGFRVLRRPAEATC
jgi:dipeptidyl aminopeptidase/acylaminoacyl peptidase